MYPVEKIMVRCVAEQGKLRLRTETSPAMYVQAPTAWRYLCERGTAFSINARLRADGECYVLQPRLH